MIFCKYLVFYWSYGNFSCEKKFSSENYYKRFYIRLIVFEKMRSTLLEQSVYFTVVWSYTQNIILLKTDCRKVIICIHTVTFQLCDVFVGSGVSLGRRSLNIIIIIYQRHWVASVSHSVVIAWVDLYLEYLKEHFVSDLLWNF